MRLGFEIAVNINLGNMNFEKMTALSVLVLCVALCMQSAFGATLFDYGNDVEDFKVPRGADVAQQVEFPVNFFRMPFETLYISTKGAILFDTPAEPQSRMIAPFFADIDNSKHGSIWYRTTPTEKDMARVTEDMERYFPSREFKPTDVLIVTWQNVRIQRNRGLSKGITFQAVIITDHHYTFVEYLYGDNVYPRPRALAVSPVIGFSTSNVEYFDYAIAEDTESVFEKTKSSNVNELGVWVFQVDGVNPYDIVWGIPEGGNIQGDQNVLHDVDTDLNINLGAVGDDCSTCSASATCLDYSAGSCCLCNEGHIGNGKTCLRNEVDKPFRANGAIRGTVNGEALSGINYHAFIVAAEGRTYTAISPTPQGLNYTLQLLLPIAETIGWLFARPENKGINGMTITGGTFRSTSRMRFNTGEEFTITQDYVTSGESIRNDISVSGALPVLEEKALRVTEHSEAYTRHRPGIVHSFESRSFATDSSNIYFTHEQTIEYDDCLADEAEFDPLLNAMTVTFSSVNAFHEEQYPNVRFSMRSAISPVSGPVSDPCESNDCHLFASCFPDADGYRCECFDGYSGDGYQCEVENLDPCATNGCSGNAICIPDGSSYDCECMSGYYGNGYTCLEIFVDPCQDNDCSDNADCYPADPSFVCKCHSGFEGDGVTCDPIDPCASHRCSRNAVCIPEGISSRCQCVSGYEGNGYTCFEVEDVDPCDNNRCSSNADCYTEGDTYNCRCRAGYDGDGYICDATPSGPCDRNRCDGNALCIPDGRSYYCQCAPGFEGDGLSCTATPSGPCERNRCDENALCIPDGRSYYCQCATGFQGDGLSCTEVVDDPCLNSVCASNADCLPQGSSYTCQCRSGYEGNGLVCESVSVDPCLNNDCNPLGRCIPRGSGYDCQCAAGFQGDGYTCVAYPCSNHNCDDNADCFGTDAGRSYECVCRDGFQGDGYYCQAVEVDVCEGNECDVNGECIPLLDSYDCQCREGFLGNGYFCIAEDPCFENSCDVNADCSPVGDAYQCRCRPGYRGDGYNCQVLDCSSCDANARCIQQGAGFSCECNTGFEGDGQVCEDIDECLASSSPCDPNAYCDNTFGNYVCSCREGYVGDGVRCQVAVQPQGDGKLLYGQGMAVMEMPLADGEPGTRVIHKKRQTIVGLAYDCVDELIYFTDVAKGSIGRVRPDGTEYKRLVTKGLSSPEGVAVDHLSRNLYWTDSGFDRIEVANLDGKNRRVLIETDLNNPRAIVVDAVAGYMYWTDWNRNAPKIERALMDGSEREVLVEDGLRLPNGLTLDQISQKICWADAGTEKVECISVNGDPLTRVAVFSEADYPFGLAAFDQNLYWTDWTSNSVYSVNKNGALSANKMTLPLGGTGRLYGIIAEQDCPQGSNACAYDNGGCSAICLPLPRGEKSCACPTDTRGNEIPC